MRYGGTGDHTDRYDLQQQRIPSAARVVYVVVSGNFNTGVIGQHTPSDGFQSRVTPQQRGRGHNIFFSALWEDLVNKIFPYIPGRRVCSLPVVEKSRLETRPRGVLSCHTCYMCCKLPGTVLIRCEYDY